jgi:hypothetical protein
VCHDTFYSDVDGHFKRSEKPITKGYATPSELFSEDDASPYATFTRAIHVFKPTSGRIDYLVFVNDGTAYLNTGLVHHCFCKLDLS